MAAAETARLIASLELQDRNFTRGIRNVERGVARVDRKLGAFSGFVNRNMARAIDSIGLRLVSSVGQGLEELATLEDATSSVTGAIAQVGKGWTLTADDIAQAANRIESETDAAFDDKAIVAATETLIRYGKVSEDNLEPAMEVMTDLAARTGDVESAATLLAKALADPEKAAGKLARSGVVLTKQQQKQIKEMVKAGKTAEAQAFLLEQLQKTTEGAAAASAGPYRDALNKLGDAGEDLRRGFVTGLAPAILEVSDLLTTELAKPSTMKALKDVGKEVGGALKGIIGIAKSLPWDSIGNAMKLAGTGAKAILDAFLGLPPWVQTAVLTGWGLNKITGGALTNIFGSLASGLIKGVLGMNAGVVNINAGVVNGGGLPGAAKGGPGLLGTAARLIVPVTIAGATIAGARVLSDAFNPEMGRRIDAGDTPLFNRDPRRFDRFGRVVNEFEEDLNGASDALKTMKERALGAGAATPTTSTGAMLSELARRGFVQRAGERKPATVKLDPGSVAKVQSIANAINNAKSIASRENSANKAQISKVEQKAQATANAVKNAQSIASRENSAQKAEIARAKQAAATAGRNTATAARGTTSAVQGARISIAASQAAAATRIVTAIYAARPVIRPTNIVERTTTIYRTGTTSGSRRSGPLE